MEGCCRGVIVIVLLLSILPRVFAAGQEYSFVKNASVAPRNATDYDYIIVGGGTAGCPLAATLSLNYSVLLLERGNTPYGNPDVENAANFKQFISNLHRNTWLSPVESFQSQDGVFNRRARVLGGGTAINAGFYSSASDDYVTRAGWDKGMGTSSYARVEAAVAFFPRLQQWQSAVRDPLLEVGIGPDNGNSHEQVKGTKVGGSIFDDAGRRHIAVDLLQHTNSFLVRFNYFSAPEDLFTCSETTRVVHQILKTEAMVNLTYTSLPDAIRQNAHMIGSFMPDDLDVTILADWCLNTGTTVWHYHGGCQVGSVVDGEYRVIGAAGLRVIDGSTFNSTPGTNSQATVMMLGRCMGLKIHQDRQYGVEISGDVPSMRDGSR